jgi:non-ribosomal peptide synthetase component F
LRISVRFTPRQDHIAVADEKGHQLTYRQLNERADALSHEIRARYPGPSRTTTSLLDSYVGVLMDRTVGMVVATLAVLKAGCAFVPLVPGTPRERQAYILKDASCWALVASARVLEAQAPRWPAGRPQGATAAPPREDGAAAPLPASLIKIVVDDKGAPVGGRGAMGAMAMNPGEKRAVRDTLVTGAVTPSKFMNNPLLEGKKQSQRPGQSKHGSDSGSGSGNGNSQSSLSGGSGAEVGGDNGVGKGGGKGKGARGSGRSPCYVFYTSGSSGIAKGVVCDHQNVVNYVEWWAGLNTLQSGETMVGVTSADHDPIMTDMFGVFAAGGRLYIAAEESQRSGARLMDIMQVRDLL